MADEDYGGESHDNFVFHVIRIIGTAFDFQLFNAYSKSEAGGALPTKTAPIQHVPSTVFLAADHLSNVLLGDLVPRACANHQMEIGQAFVESVWVLHAKLFRAYSDWAVKQVDLPIRPREDQTLMDRGYSDDAVIRILMAEISLYILIYTEAANLRHMPEFMSLLFWLLRFSPAFSSALATMQPLSDFTARRAGVSLRAEYELARNECAGLVDELAAAVATSEVDQKWANIEKLVRSRSDIPKELMDTVVDLIMFGDGGAFLHTMVQPMFLLLSYLEDKLGGSGHDTSTRLTYDDCNDSLCYQAVVQRALLLLGVEDLQDYNMAFQALQRMGRVDDGAAFDPRIPAQWWEKEVFQKVFVERRGWLHVFRNNAATLTTFILVIQVVVVFTFVSFNFNAQNLCRHTALPDCGAFGVDASRCRWCLDLCWVGWSSLAITHFFLTTLHQWSNWYLSKQPSIAPPLSSLPKDAIHLKATWNLDHTTGLATNRRASPALPLAHVVRDGHVPLAAAHYILLLLAMVWVYFSQFNPGNYGYIMSKLWIALGSMYAVFWLVRVVMVVRDGYTRRLALTCVPSATALGADNGGCSGVPPAAHTKATNPKKTMKVGWRSFSRNTLLWLLTLSASLLAIYCEGYNLLRYLVIWALNDYTVEVRGTWRLGAYNTGLPQPGTQIILALMLLVTAVLSVWPFISLINIIAGTQLFSSIVGVRHGFNAAKNWPQFAKLFESAADLFCLKCLPRSVSASRDPVQAFSTVWNPTVLDFWSRDMLSLPEAHALSYLEIPDTPLTVAMDLPLVFPPPFSLGPHLATKLPPPPCLPFLTPPQSITRDASKLLSLILWVLADLSLLTPNQAAQISRLMAAAADEPTTRTRVNSLTTLALQWALDAAPSLPLSPPNAHVCPPLPSAAPPGTAPPGPPAVHPGGTPHGSITSRRYPRGDPPKGGAKGGADGGAGGSGQAPPGGGHLLAPVGRTSSITNNRLGGSFSRPHSLTSAAGGGGPMRSAGSVGVGTPAKSGASMPAGFKLEARPGGLGVQQGVQQQQQQQQQQRGVAGGDVVKEVGAAGGLEALLRELRSCLWDWEKDTEQAPLSMALFCELDTTLQDACAPAALARAHAQLSHGITAKPSPLISTVRYLGCVASCTTWAGSEPRSKEAEWLLRLFVKSLHNPKLGRKPACHVATMPSLTTLIPLYNEDISMAYDSAEATVAMMAAHHRGALTTKDVSGAQVVSLPEAPKTDPLAPKDTSQVWYGCMGEIEKGVSQASYLTRTYALDWDNFRTRMAVCYNVRRALVTPEAFASGAPLHHLQQEFCEWVSGRSQMLSRHIRGLQCSAVATRVLLRLECPRPEEWTEEYYEQWVEAVVGRKYQTIVAAQTLGDKLKSAKPRDQYNARAILYLLNRYPFMQAAMLKNEPKAACGRYTQQYSVLVRGRSYFACSEVAPDEHAVASMSLYHTSVLQQELDDYEVEYCIRLPVNVFTGRGIIIGEGKAENHNSAMPYITSELVQGNDMNMDNLLSEAFKLRSLVSEALARDPLARMLRAVAPRYLGDTADPADDVAEDVVVDVAVATAPQVSVPQGTSAATLAALLQAALSRPQLAIIGMTSWICTAFSGPVAMLNNYLELLFIFNIQRYMQYCARVRYHYGYADVWNKFWAMTTTGLSRPVRNVNVVEDLTVGVRVALKGGVIKHRDYIMSGKGRETNLLGIYSYHRKIGAGIMEATFGRDFFRLHKVHDLFRQSSSYIFMNNTAVNIHLMFAAAISRLLTDMVSTLLNTPSVASNTQGGMIATMPPWFPQRRYLSQFFLTLLIFWFSVLLVVLFGPEEYIQNGWRGVFQMFLTLTIRGYVVFTMLILKIWEFFGTSATKYMAGKYIATGRGLGLHHVPFPQMYIFWGRGFWTFSAVITTLAVAHQFNVNPAPSTLAWYNSSMTFPLIFAGFLLIGPSWFTPLAFHPRIVAGGLRDWARWMWFGAKDRGTGVTWAAFNQERTGHLLDKHGHGADYWTTWFGCVIVLAIRAAVTAAYIVKILSLYVRDELARAAAAGAARRSPAPAWLGDLPRALDDAVFGWLRAGHGYWGEVADMMFRSVVFWGILLLVFGPIHQLVMRTRLNKRPSVKVAAVVLYHVLGLVLFAQVHYRFITAGIVARCLFLLLVWHANVGELLALLVVPIPLRPVRHAVEQAYWLGDYLVGSAVLLFHVALALPLFVHWMQAALIFTDAGYQRAPC